VIIPHQTLSADALQNMVEEFVTRSGTDYGADERSLAEKVHQVMHQLEKGEAVIVYDPALETCNITTAAQARANAPAETE
jgi:hypothetical protein